MMHMQMKIFQAKTITELQQKFNVWSSGDKYVSSISPIQQIGNDAVLTLTVVYGESEAATPNRRRPR